MLPDAIGRLFGRWSEPIGGTPAGLAAVLRWLAILLRFYAGGLTGLVLGWIGLQNVAVLGNIGFIPYGYDKLLGGNQRFGMDAGFFQTIGVPLPELTLILIGLLELFGGLALIAGLLTRLFGFLLACNMLVAMLTVGNTAEELPLFIACALLVWTGGGMFSLDQLIDQRLGHTPARAGTAERPIRS
ncbi:MAG TPA: DoxX family protein [Chloroflexia bacterium]